MKMRLFSTLVSILVLSTASSLAYTIGPLNNGLNYLVANQLNHTGGNSLANLFPVGFLPDMTAIEIYNCSGTFTTYYSDKASPSGWDDAFLDPLSIPEANAITSYLNPGEGFFIVPSATINSLTFTGTPKVPVQVPTPLPCGCGQFNFLSRQTNGICTYENMTGLTPQNGAVFRRWNVAIQSYDVYIYTNCLWTPSVPTVGVGEAAWILVPCTTNYPCPCPPEPFVLFNTGEDANGAVLTNGAVDPHYVLTTNPNGGGSNALVVDGNGLANTPNSAWIAPTGNLNINNGTYVYRMTFNLPCTNNVIIMGQWAADNLGAIQLNGNP